MKISVIIPAYNCEQYIVQTLDCIYAQTMSRADIEVIVCLDAPTDNTETAVRKWVDTHRDMYVKIIANKTNLGVSAARNMAIKSAHGEYIHFMDSDDLINTDFYRALYDSAMRSGADVAVASYQHQMRPDCSIVFDDEMVVTNPQDRIDFTRVDQHGMMWRFLVRRDFWRSHRFNFPADMTISEDWLLANRVVFDANYIVLVSGAMYIYCARGNSLMAQMSRQKNACADGARASADVRAFLNKNGLRHYVRHAVVRDVRLFGFLRLFVVSEYNNWREWRLFGRVLICRTVLNYRLLRPSVMANKKSGENK